MVVLINSWLFSLQVASMPCGYSFVTEDRSNLTLQNTQLEQFWKGISLTSCFGIAINGNNLTDINTGIKMDSCNNSIYKKNVSNSKYAMMLENYEETWVVVNNTFYQNNFVNISQMISIESLSHQNYWDNGSKGNYWSNYNGTDNNANSIGDNHYMIDANNIDNYPLMTPYESTQ